MPTVVLDAYSKAYPSITNRIRASVFLETDPFALVATIIDVTVGHPARIWHFPGLPRANYGFSLDEINGSGDPINNLALFSVVPGAIDGTLVRNDEQIRVGTTTGFETGASSATFDGSGGTPNYIGWDIVPSELTGRGILVEGQDYSWNPLTGEFALLLAGDVLSVDTWYNIHFNPMENTMGGSVPTVIDFQSRIVTTTGNIDITDFANNVICEPDGTYMELTLPAINTVPQGRILRLEVKPAIGSGIQCVNILPNGADIINWLRGNIYLHNNENIEIYRLRRPDLSNEWRVRAPDGNFKTVGQLVDEDCIQSDVVCKQFLDGTIADKFQFARIYNEIVLNLPGTQVCDFDDWATGNNKYLYSLANSTDPDNLDKFHFPDRRGLFERNNISGKAGDYFDDTYKEHRHFSVVPIALGGTPPNPLPSTSIVTQNDAGPGDFKYILKGDATEPTVGRSSLSGSSETMPKHYLTNKYVLI